jgi:Holliday junction resolvase
MGKFQTKMSQRQERELEEQWPKSKRTIGSGAKWEKADLQTTEFQGMEFMIECKSTQSSSFSITKSIWNTVKSHAQNKSWLSRPILAVRLYGPTIEMTEWGERENTPENLPVELDLIVLDKDDFLELYSDYLRLKEKDN